MLLQAIDFWPQIPSETGWSIAKLSYSMAYCTSISVCRDKTLFLTKTITFLNSQTLWMSPREYLISIYLVLLKLKHNISMTTNCTLQEELTSTKDWHKVNKLH